MEQKTLTNKELIEQIRAVSLDLGGSRKNRTIRFLTATTITICVCLCAAIVAITQTTASIERAYQEYVSSNTDFLTIDLLQYKDTYAVYELRNMGNSNSNLITGGFFAERNGIAILPNEDLTDTYIYSAVNQDSLCGELCNFVNIYDDYVYFRKTSDRHVYRKSISDGKIESFIDAQVSTFLIADGMSYYTLMDDSGTLLQAYNHAPYEARVLLRNVDTFAVFGSYVIFLTDNNELRILDTDSGVSNLISENIEAFLFNGSLVILSNGNLHLVNLQGNEIQKLDIPGTGVDQLISVHDDKVIFSCDRALYSYSINSGQFTKYAQGFDLYLSASITECGISIVVANLDRETGSFVKCIIVGD